MDFALRARRLVKRYPKAPPNVYALSDVDLEVPHGITFGLIGRNGAGKTTFVRIAATQLEHTSGDLEVLGRDVRTRAREIRPRIACIPQESRPLYFLTTEEVVYLNLKMRGMDPVEARRRTRDVLAELELEPYRKTLVSRLSGGLRRRALVAMAFASDAELLFLDEPTTGLDPHARHLVWQQLAALRSKGVTLLLTTHYMEEASRLCDRLVVMDQGRILAEGRPADLVEAQVGRQVVELPGAEGLEPERDLPDTVLRLVRRTHWIGSSLFLFTDDNRSLLDALASLRPDLAARALARPATLEDVFLTLAGRGLTD